MNYKIVPRIKAAGWPVDSKGYKEAHRSAETHERMVFGTKRFKGLQMAIESRIPKDELAGSHTKEGDILVSSKIPTKYHSQIAEHERYEHRRMTKRRTLRKIRRR